MSTASSVVLASPVRQDPAVLEEFLRAVSAAQAVTGCEFWAYDDTDNVEARQLLTRFMDGQKRRAMPRLPLPALEPYLRLADTHIWAPETYQRVGRIKDWIIAQFMASEHETLMFVDSDVLIPPGLPQHLLALDLPVVTEVFWTRWHTGEPYLPQVWHTHPGHVPDAEWIIRLRQPGTYRVGGLGACTLIRRLALAHGLSFAPIEALQYLGEDRYFCVRAAVLGIPLHADTALPPYHVYRQDDIAPGGAWLEAGCPITMIRGWLDASWERSVRQLFHPTPLTGVH